MPASNTYIGDGTHVTAATALGTEKLPGRLAAGGDIYVTLDDIAGYAISNGWVAASETWTRTGNHTFTISTNVTAKYRKGTKVRYQDGGGSDEYGVIYSSSYSAPNTTVTLFTNTNYAMAAATITNKYISHIENPEGWPDFLDYTPAVSSSSGAITSYTVVVGKFRVQAQKCEAHCAITISNNGTGSGQINIGLPAATVGFVIGNGKNITSSYQIMVSNGDAQTTGAIAKYDNSYPAATGDTLRMIAVFEY